MDMVRIKYKIITRFNNDDPVFSEIYSVVTHFHDWVTAHEEMVEANFIGGIKIISVEDVI